MVYEWLDQHQDELLANWERLGKSEEPVRIDPLQKEIIVPPWLRKEDIMKPILKVINADYVRDHVLRLSFNDGVTKLVDFWPLAQKGICTKLQNMDYFRNYFLDPFTVDWSNEIGFAPEYLYEIGTAA